LRKPAKTNWRSIGGGGGGWGGLSTTASTEQRKAGVAQRKVLTSKNRLVRSISKLSQQWSRSSNEGNGPLRTWENAHTEQLNVKLCQMTGMGMAEEKRVKNQRERGLNARDSGSSEKWKKEKETNIVRRRTTCAAGVEKVSLEEPELK